MAFGCTDKSKAGSEKVATGDEAPRPVVPLRIWWVAGEGIKERVARQWAATSERPIEIRTFTEQSLLAEKRPQCDLILAPARLLGELVARKWVEELPASMNDSASSRSLPPALVEQTTYGKKRWGVALGQTLPIVISGFSINDSKQPASTTQDPQAWWKSALAKMDAASNASNDKDAAAASTSDADQAVVDRFLVIAASLTKGDARLGLLIDPESMQAKLAEPQFVAALKILKELYVKNSNKRAVLGSWDEAWQAAASSGKTLTIGMPRYDAEGAQPATTVESCLPPQIAISNLMRATWNTGEGIVCSVSKECRQSGPSAEFTKWLAQTETRTVLSRVADGVDAIESQFTAGTSAWRAAQLVQKLSAEQHLPIEPRMVGALEYRDALKTHIARALTGQATVEDSLAAANQAWNEITKQRDKAAQRSSYEQSLGL